MKCYKLTDKLGETRGKTKWGPGISHETDGTGELCSSGWLHFYRDPLLAVLLNPIHANFPDDNGKHSRSACSMRLWEAEAEGHIKDNAGLKSGCTKLTTTHEIPVPKVTTEQRVRFAILCVKQVCIEPEWNKWADAWLSNKDRSASAASKAWEAAKTAEGVAWTSAEKAAKAAAEATKAAARAAWASEWASESAARAADWATDATNRKAGKSIDLSSIAHKSVDTAEF